jgi:hypothetical protein
MSDFFHKDRFDSIIWIIIIIVIIGLFLDDC